jgi:MoxR-like ATPase
MQTFLGRTQMGTVILKSNQDLEYSGDIKFQPKRGERDPDTKEILCPYIPVSPGLVEAVNLAIKLNRPLLLEGEPGCGKTRLARAVAYEFTQRYSPEEEKIKIKWPYTDWNIKSSDQARDGLYIYDAVRRLFDAQLAANDPSEKDKIRERLDDKKHTAYIQCGALGKAFKASQENQRMIVLIDEIDKADTDFPNDLLLELEEKRFIIKETGENIVAQTGFAPIIFITSNGQRKLPDAFLRRCLYHYIEFPGKQELLQIVEAHFGKIWSKKLREKAINRFMALRKLMEEEKGDFGKKVSSSELIDWFYALQPKRKAEEIKKLFAEHKLPYPSVLLKSRDDLYLADLVTEEEDLDSDER